MMKKQGLPEKKDPPKSFDTEVCAKVLKTTELLAFDILFQMLGDMLRGPLNKLPFSAA
jgi:hypothetical protein